MFSSADHPAMHTLEQDAAALRTLEFIVDVQSIPWTKSRTPLGEGWRWVIRFKGDGPFYEGFIQKLEIQYNRSGPPLIRFASIIDHPLISDIGIPHLSQKVFGLKEIVLACYDLTLSTPKINLPGQKPFVFSFFCLLCSEIKRDSFFLFLVCFFFLCFPFLPFSFLFLFKSIFFSYKKY